MEEKLELDVDIEVDATQFLDTILEKSNSLSSRIDNQLNILLGLGTALFVLSASKIDFTGNYWWIVLAFFSGLSALIGLFSVHPPRFISKVGQSESLIYNKNIIKFKNSKEYSKKLLEVIGSKEAIVQQYATEIYNIYKYYYRPKRNLFKLSRILLVTGVLIGFALFLVSKI